MDIGTYQETMRLLAKIDRKAKQEQKAREEELTPFQSAMGFILFMVFTVAIHTLAYYLQ